MYIFGLETHSRELITHERASDGLLVLLIKATESVGCTLAT